MLNTRVPVITAAVLTATTTVTTTTSGDPYAENDAASDEAVIVAPDLAIAATHNGAFRVGEEAAWTLGVTNGGGAPTSGPVTVDASVPAGIDVTGADGHGWSCSILGQDVICVLDASVPAAGSSPSISLTVKPTPTALATGETTGTTTIEATVQTENDSDSSNDEATDEADLVAVDQALSMSGPAQIAVGEQASWELRVENTGAAATRGGTTVIDTLPAGFSAGNSGGDGWVCSTGANQVTCEHSAESAPGSQLEPLTIRARAEAAAASTSTNQAVAQSAGDVIADNDSASFDSEVTKAPDLEASLAGRAASFRVGADAGYELKVKNVGSAAADGPTTVGIDLPAGAGFVESDHGQGWSCDDPSGGQVTCENQGTIGPDKISTLGFRLTFGTTTAASVTVKATAQNDADSNSANDESSLTSQVSRIDLALTRSRNGEWVRPGTGSYTLRVENRGTAGTVAPATITETLPLGTTLAAAHGEGWACQVSGRVLRCVDRDPIAAGESSSLDVTVDISRLAGTPINASSAVATVDDVDRANDTASERIDLTDATKPDPAQATIRAGKVEATKSGVATIWLSCPEAAAVKCRGELQLKTDGKVKVKKVKRKFRKAKLKLGQAGYALAAGQTAPIQVQLSNKGRKALKLNGKLKAVATAVGEGVSASKAKITIARAR